jgi:hypothetical protein
MFTFIDGLPPNVMAVEASGTVTHEDYRDIIIPKAEEMMAKGPIKLLYVIGSSQFQPRRTGQRSHVDTRFRRLARTVLPLRCSALSSL